MPFVHLAALPQHRAVARLRQFLEIVDDEGVAVAADGDVLLAEAEGLANSAVQGRAKAQVDALLADLAPQVAQGLARA